ncbi:MAG: hypothetical protein QM753_00555 [Thermomicrobiales bacterium]
MRVGWSFSAVRVLIVALVCGVFAALPLGQSVSAYQGETQKWATISNKADSIIVIGRLDTGDPNSNTDFVEALDVEGMREILGSDASKVRFVRDEEPVVGTTVNRHFSFVTSDGYDARVIVTDEWGPNIWMFTVMGVSPKASELDAFVSATVQNRYPSKLPKGYGPIQQMDR